MAKSIEWEVQKPIELDNYSDISEDGFVINDEKFMKTTIDFKNHEKDKKIHEEEAKFLQE